MKKIRMDMKAILNNNGVISGTRFRIVADFKLEDESRESVMTFSGYRTQDNYFNLLTGKAQEIDQLQSEYLGTIQYIAGHYEGMKYSGIRIIKEVSKNA